MFADAQYQPPQDIKRWNNPSVNSLHISVFKQNIQINGH